ncbi:MAG: asparagine synthase (glutamine-hydrolyzing) [Candidatus Omnitrophica bacterium]|nr:asparagine synthase (glutamine-hydrolyzing) [Candidatus Omnitrophota bacterium]
MCGVAGIFSYHYASSPVDRGELRAVRDFMARRGPDGSGEWFSEDGRVALGHRRLAIIDLSPGGAQPMASPDGKLAISFNGEIYNYRELRGRLEKKGRVFGSQSDTEVLLHLYAEEGTAMLGSLRGMFAFALWDGEKKLLFLARDPYGIKPLYYADDGWTVRVASQVKALLAGGRVSQEKDAAGAVGFFLWGSVPEPHTLYQEIRQVPAGSLVVVDEAGVNSPRTYLSVEGALGGPPSGGFDRARFDETARAALTDSVAHHFVADVPVGIFLSGGLDSGALTALATQAGQRNVRTVTLGFEEYQGSVRDERPWARAIAGRYGTDHKEYILSAGEFRRELPSVLDAMDQPSIDGVNTYFVSKAAAQTGLKVALSGLGGDELFGGYPSFWKIPRLVRFTKPFSFLPFAGDLFRILPVPHPKLSGLLKYGADAPGAYFLVRGLFMPWELGAVLDRDLAREGLRRLEPRRSVREGLPFKAKATWRHVAALEARFYLRNQLLRDADWAGMAHSLEIRTPFVDAEALKVLAPALDPRFFPEGKAFLARLAGPQFPAEAARKPKTGFTVPVDEWLRSEEFGEWKKVPLLASPSCPWARRWAYTVYRRMVA